MAISRHNGIEKVFPIDQMIWGTKEWKDFMSTNPSMFVSCLVFTYWLNFMKEVFSFYYEIVVKYIISVNPVELQDR